MKIDRQNCSLRYFIETTSPSSLLPPHPLPPSFFRGFLLLTLLSLLRFSSSFVFFFLLQSVFFLLLSSFFVFYLLHFFHPLLRSFIRTMHGFEEFSETYFNSYRKECEWVNLWSA